MSVKEKFLDYVSYDTQSDSSSTTMPSTMKQKLLAQHLADEMVAMGIEDAHMDEWGYVYGTIPANCEKKNVIGFIAHMDTAEEVSGANVKARVIENYDGEDIVLNKELGIVTDVENFPILKKFKGKTLIVTDGTTLLGADDKAGVAEIMQAAEDIIKNNLPTAKSISHLPRTRKSAQARISSTSRASAAISPTRSTAASLAASIMKTSTAPPPKWRSPAEACIRAAQRTR